MAEGIRMSDQRRQQRLRTFEVEIDAHTLANARYIVPATTQRLPAANAQQALRLAVRVAHHAAGVPPWLPCVRASLTKARIV